MATDKLMIQSGASLPAVSASSKSRRFPNALRLLVPGWAHALLSLSCLLSHAPNYEHEGCREHI